MLRKMKVETLSKCNFVYVCGGCVASPSTNVARVGAVSLLGLPVTIYVYGGKSNDQISQ